MNCSKNKQFVEIGPFHTDFNVINHLKNPLLLRMLSLEQDGLVPQPQPDSEASVEGPGPSEEVLERLAQTEQLVVQLKELIREKDSRLASTEKQFKVCTCIMRKEQTSGTN